MNSRRLIILSLLLASFLVAPQVFAQTTGTGFVPLAPIPGLTEGATANSAGLATFFNNLYKYLIGLAAALAVIMIIWGGLEYSTQDSISKKSDGKQRIYSAILGLVLVLSPVLVFSIINPSILNLSVNLPSLSTAPTTGGGPGTGSTPPPLCSPTVTTNCVEPPKKDGGPSQLQFPGWWCFGTKPQAGYSIGDAREIQFNYFCAEKRIDCEWNLKFYAPGNATTGCIVSPTGTPVDTGFVLTKTECGRLGDFVKTEKNLTCTGASAALRNYKNNCWDVSTTPTSPESGLCVW